MQLTAGGRRLDCCGFRETKRRSDDLSVEAPGYVLGRLARHYWRHERWGVGTV